jgi:hypothetical protein
MSTPIYIRACTGICPRDARALLKSKGLLLSSGKFWGYMDTTVTPEQIQEAVLYDGVPSPAFFGHLTRACNVPALVEIIKMCREGRCDAARPSTRNSGVCGGVLVSHARYCCIGGLTARGFDAIHGGGGGNGGGGADDAHPFVRCARAGYPIDARRVVSEIVSKRWRGKDVEAAMAPALHFMLAIGALGVDPSRIPSLSSEAPVDRGNATTVGGPVDLRWVYERAARSACLWVLEWLHRRVPPDARPLGLDIPVWVAKGGMKGVVERVFDTASLALSLGLRFGIRIDSHKLMDRGKWHERDPEDPLAVCEWAVGQGYHLDGPLFCALAAARGKMALVRWARAKGCRWDGVTALGALYHFVRCSYVGSHCESAKELLDWVLAEGCPYFADAMTACCTQSGYRWDDRAKTVVVEVLPTVQEVDGDLLMDGGGGEDVERGGGDDGGGDSGEGVERGDGDGDVVGEDSGGGDVTHDTRFPPMPWKLLGTPCVQGTIGLKRRTPEPTQNKTQVRTPMQTKPRTQMDNRAPTGGGGSLPPLQQGVAVGRVSQMRAYKRARVDAATTTAPTTTRENDS